MRACVSRYSLVYIMMLYLWLLSFLYTLLSALIVFGSLSSREKAALMLPRWHPSLSVSFLLLLSLSSELLSHVIGFSGVFGHSPDFGSVEEECAVY